MKPFIHIFNLHFFGKQFIFVERYHFQCSLIIIGGFQEVTQHNHVLVLSICYEHVQCTNVMSCLIVSNLYDIYLLNSSCNIYGFQIALLLDNKHRQDSRAEYPIRHLEKYWYL